MDHYERLEQIDYKSARDVVTEADHLSEALILDAIRARYPDDAILAEETGEHRAVGGRGAHLGAWPGLDRRPARRHGELRQRHPRSSASRSGWSSTGGRRSGSSSTRPGTRRSRRRSTVRRPLAGRPVRASDKEKLSDFVISMALNGRTGRDPGAERPQGDPDLALDGLGRAGAGLRRERPVRRVHPAGRPVRLGRRGRRAHRRARPARRSPR